MNWFLALADLLGVGVPGLTMIAITMIAIIVIILGRYIVMIIASVMIIILSLISFISGTACEALIILTHCLAKHKRVPGPQHPQKGSPKNGTAKNSRNGTR